MDRQAIYDQIKAAKEAMIPTHADGATKDTVVTEDAQKQYMKEAKRLFGTDPVTGNLIAPSSAELVIAAVRTAKTIGTLRKRARAVRHFAMAILKASLKLIDTAQRAGDWEKVEKLVTHPKFLACVTLCKMMPKNYRDGWVEENPRSSKKKSLKGLPPNWRELVAEQAHGQFRSAVLVALLTGCRPAELEKGVLIERINGELFATIQGAKVKETAGQKQRRFRIAAHPITDMLKRVMEESDETRNMMLVKVEHGNSVTTHVREIGKKLWPRKKQSITVYSARHAIATDCKAVIHEGADPDLVSQVLGHVVDKTSSYYGARFQSGGISMAPSEITVPKPIKQKTRQRNHQRGIDRGLLKKQGALSVSAGL
jgi:integrase